MVLTSGGIGSPLQMRRISFHWHSESCWFKELGDSVPNGIVKYNDTARSENEVFRNRKERPKAGNIGCQ